MYHALYLPADNAPGEPVMQAQGAWHGCFMAAQAKPPTVGLVVE
jgi:hypothetical protein